MRFKHAFLPKQRKKNSHSRANMLFRPPQSCVWIMLIPTWGQVRDSVLCLGHSHMVLGLVTPGPRGKGTPSSTTSVGGRESKILLQSSDNLCCSTACTVGTALFLLSGCKGKQNQCNNFWSSTTVQGWSNAASPVDSVIHTLLPGRIF